MEIKSVIEHIEDLYKLLSENGFKVFYKKINDVINGEYIIIVEQKREPVNKNDMIDVFYESYIEINYISKTYPINFVDMYNIRDKILSLLVSNGYQIDHQRFELIDKGYIIRIVIKLYTT